MMTYLKAAAALAVMSVSACGGSTLSPEEQLASLDERGDEIFETYIAGESILSASAMPSRGSANFSGPLITRGGVGNPLDDTDQVRVLFLGEINLAADFAAGTIAGLADNFVDVENLEEFGDGSSTLQSGGTVDGSLTFEGTQAASAAASYDLIASGELEGPNDSYLSFVNVGGSADVYGANADALDIGGGALVTFDGVNGFISYTGVAAQ